MSKTLHRGFRHVRLLLVLACSATCLGWLSNLLLAPICHESVRGELAARLQAFRAESKNAPELFQPGPLIWIPPSELVRRTDGPWSLTFPYFAYAPREAAAFHSPYAWVRTGTLIIPFFVPIYSADLTSGQAGSGHVAVFFTPLGRRGLVSSRMLWVN
jgi:hypothetical protein